MTVTVTRFDRPRKLAAGGGPGVAGGPLFSGHGYDHREVGLSREGGEARVWAAVALHPNLEQARGHQGAAATAEHQWSALLQPFRHHGRINWLDPAEPGPIFEVGPAPHPEEPLVAMTSVGFDPGPAFDPSRPVEFSRRVDDLYRAMEGISGLGFRHVYVFGRGPDPITLSLWDSLASMQAFAYRPGDHKVQLDAHRSDALADRTSFTRFRLLEVVER
jgi:hypothetical protein